MLSRCKVGMVIVANRSFLSENVQASQTLVAKLAVELNSEWISWQDVAKGKQIFEPKVSPPAIGMTIRSCVTHTSRK
jgi:hypothetical protein